MTQGGSQQFRRAGWLGIMIAIAVVLVGPGWAWAEDTTPTGNRVFFRGGFAALNSDRQNELFTDGHGAGGLHNDNSTGYYVGAGEDVMMTKDLWA